MDEAAMSKAKDEDISRYPGLFSPFRIGSLPLKNRLVALPVYPGYAHPDGRVSALLTGHYSRLASSGVAMVVVANAAVAEDGVTSRYTIRIDKDDFIPGLASLARAIKAQGALACLQLNHAGRFAKTERPLLPSPITGTNLGFNIASLRNFMDFFPLEKRFGLTVYILRQINTWRRAMTEEDRRRVITSFGQAALRAYRAGFDMIELHGANGYLLCQFLSPFTNKTPSDCGGDFEARTVFPLAVIREIKERLPRGFPVGFRLLLREWVPGGIEFPEALDWARLLEKEGIAYVSTSAGTYNSIFLDEVRKEMARSAYLRNDTADLTRELRVPTIISGRITSPSLANELIRNKEADLIGLGRPLTVDILWVAKAAGQGQKIRACANCNGCLKRVVLDQGLNCRSWPKWVQERMDLEHKLLTRMFKSLWVAADLHDLELFKISLPVLLPESQGAYSFPISPTILFLQTDGDGDVFSDAGEGFLSWARALLDGHGFTQGVLTNVVRTSRESPDVEVHQEVEREGHGIILMGQNRDQPWRERLLYRERWKVVGLMGSNLHQYRVLVPIDLSSSSLLVLMFLRHSFVGKAGIQMDLVHVLTGPSGPAERRWKALKKILDWDEDMPLRFVPSEDKVTTTLLGIMQEGGYGTVVMGKRGLSGIKRWLLGSVSAGVSRGLTNQSLFLID